MLAAWQVIRCPPQSLLYFRPVQQTCCRAVQRGYKAFSVVNAQDQSDIFSRVQVNFLHAVSLSAVLIVRRGVLQTPTLAHTLVHDLT